MKNISHIIAIILLSKLSVVLAMETPSGNYFDENDDPHFTNAVNVLTRKIRLADYDSITDIECRNGKIAVYIHEQSPKSTVMGKDSSLKNIVELQDRYRAEKNLLFKVMNIRSPNAERRAKLVTCLQGAHLCPNKSDFFLGVTHLLQSGGTLLLTAPLKSSRTCALLASLKKITQKTEWQSCFKSQDFEKEYVPFESTAALEELLKQNHFLNVEIEVEQNIPRFQNAKALTKYIAQDLQVFNTFRVLTGEQKEQFSNAVTAEYLAQIPSSPDGTIQFPQITVIAKAIYHPYNFFSGSWPVYSPKKRHTP